MTTRPSVRVEPRPDESVPSMLARLARTLGVSQRSLLGGGRSHLYFSNPDWALHDAAEVLGVSVEVLRRHTLDGRLDPRRTASLGSSFELRTQRWLTCPACSIGTFWTALALVTACTDCGVLLVPGPRDDQRARPRPVAAPTQALAMQQAYLRLLQADGTGPELTGLRARFDRVARLRTFWRRAGRDNVAGPTRGRDSPSAVADFAIHAWPASATEQTTIALIAESMRHQLPRPVSDTGALPKARRRLHCLLADSGITHRHVPTYVLPGRRLVHASPFDLDVGLAASRALRREAVRAQCGARPVDYLLDRRGGPLHKRCEALTLDRHLETTAAGLDTLGELAHHLADGGVVDYLERAATLAMLKRVPRAVLARCATPGLDPELAAAWTRLELTDDPLSAAWRRGELAALDYRLSPEDRLILLEHGRQIMTAVADDIAAATTGQPLSGAPFEKAADAS